MIVLRSAPYLVGIVGVINFPAGIFILNAFCEGLSVISIAFQNALAPVSGISADKHMETIGPVTENIVGAPANDHTALLICQILNDLCLGNINGVRWCQLCSPM